MTHGDDLTSMHLAGITDGNTLVSCERIDEGAFASTCQAHNENVELSGLFAIESSRAHGFLEFMGCRHLH